MFLKAQFMEKLRLYTLLGRFDKPIGYFLLFFPCVWGLGLGQEPASTFGLDKMTLFWMGAIFIRSAACIYNDWVDRDFDRKVARTKERPLASGKVSPLGALIMGVICAFFALNSLLLTKNPFVIKAGFILGILILPYPWLKRYTHWPQLYLGLILNSGVFLGYWIYQPGHITISLVLLYASGVLWTLVYDTIYAYQDKQDDILLGLKSLAIRLGEKPIYFLSVCRVLMLLFLLMIGLIEHMHAAYYLFMLFLGLFFLWEMGTLEIQNTQNCAKRFNVQVLVGFVIKMAIFLGR